MGGLSLKIYNVRLIIFWYKSAPFPTFPIPGKKAQSTESGLAYMAPTFTPTPHIQHLLAVALPPVICQAHPLAHCSGQGTLPPQRVVVVMHCCVLLLINGVILLKVPI